MFTSRQLLHVAQWVSWPNGQPKTVAGKVTLEVIALLFGKHASFITLLYKVMRDNNSFSF